MSQISRGVAQDVLAPPYVPHRHAVGTADKGCLLIGRLCRLLLPLAYADGFEEDQLYSASLPAYTVSMGDIKAMEIAQAVHQTVLLHRAKLPGYPVWVGSP
eukprot:5086849-Amphidinium_carterae.3